MTRSYSDSIALAAAQIVAASAVDITEPVAILPLAKQLMQETGCKIDAAKRHVARAVRLARGELTTSPTWGGKRQPAGGRPKMKITIGSYVRPSARWGWEGFEIVSTDDANTVLEKVEAGNAYVAGFRSRFSIPTEKLLAGLESGDFFIGTALNGPPPVVADTIPEWWLEALENRKRPTPLGPQTLPAWCG